MIPAWFIAFTSKVDSVPFKDNQSYLLENFPLYLKAYRIISSKLLLYLKLMLILNNYH